MQLINKNNFNFWLLVYEVTKIQHTCEMKYHMKHFNKYIIYNWFIFYYFLHINRWIFVNLNLNWFNSVYFISFHSKHKIWKMKGIEIWSRTGFKCVYPVIASGIVLKSLCVLNDAFETSKINNSIDFKLGSSFQLQVWHLLGFYLWSLI